MSPPPFDPRLARPFSIQAKPLTLASLRGKVVLIDFWTYSCINCLRTLPHLEAWDKAYRAKGLVTFTDSEWSSLFNFTCGRTGYEWRERVEPGFLGQSVFIGGSAASLRDELSARLDGCLAGLVGIANDRG